MAATGSDVLDRARAAADAIRLAQRGHAFTREVEAFTQLLKGIPDSRPSAFPADIVPLLRSLADEVIVQIEDRLTADRDRDRVQVELAGAVYAIRGALEEIDRWSRHFGREIT